MRREHDNCTRYLQDILGMTFDVSTSMNMRLLHHIFIRNAALTCCHYMPSIGALKMQNWGGNGSLYLQSMHSTDLGHWQGRGAKVDCGRKEYLVQAECTAHRSCSLGLTCNSS